MAVDTLCSGASWLVMMMVHDIEFRRQVALRAESIALLAERQAVRLVAIGTDDAGMIHAALDERAIFEHFTIDLPIGIIYVTHSAYLAQNAQNLYYANGFERTGQEATFLSYRDFVESIHVPPGREATWQDFVGWFQRIRQSFRDPDFHDIDGHQVLEEIRGVITAGERGILAREDYLALGVRQSIFPAGQRDRLYDVFEKYDVDLSTRMAVAQDWDCEAVEDMMNTADPRAVQRYLLKVIENMDLRPPRAAA